MKVNNKGIYSLLCILVAFCFWGIGVGTGIFWHFPHNKMPSPELAEKYAQNLEKSLIDLLEPAVGVGNIRASVQAQIRHQDITTTDVNPYNFTKTTIHERGPVLVGQSVSVLINERNNNKLLAYQNLIKSAIGFDQKRGDQLAIEILPFIKVPYWTLGLDPICLVRIAAGLILLILMGIFWLAKEFLKQPKEKKSYYAPNEDLWHQLGNIPSLELSNLLKTRKPEITAFILYHLKGEKSSELIEFLPKDYTEQVIFHLNHIEKLSSENKSVLLQETENNLNEIIKAFQWNKKGEQNLSPDLTKLSDEEIQKLLHYVGKKELIEALQITPLSVQQIFKRNIPPALWHEIIQKVYQNPCSETQSKKAFEKIIQISKLLKEKN